MHTKTIGLIAHTGKRGVAELIKSATPRFPVCAIKPIVFVCMQRIPDSRPRL